jgi:hypothetical protein
MSDRNNLERIIKIAEAVRDLREAVPPIASLGALGSLATYGAISGKRNLEKSLTDSLESNVRLSQLADQISANARARELLSGGEGVLSSASKAIDRSLLNPNRLARVTKATASEGLLSIIRALQSKKIL